MGDPCKTQREIADLHTNNYYDAVRDTEFAWEMYNIAFYDLQEANTSGDPVKISIALAHYTYSLNKYVSAEVHEGAMEEFKKAFNEEYEGCVNEHKWYYKK